MLMACSTKEAKFYGTWTSDDHTAFTFNKDNSGQIVNPDGKKENFTWREEKGNILVNVGNTQTFRIWHMKGKYIYMNRELHKSP